MPPSPPPLINEMRMPPRNPKSLPISRGPETYNSATDVAVLLDGLARAEFGEGLVGVGLAADGAASEVCEVAREAVGEEEVLGVRGEGVEGGV